MGRTQRRGFAVRRRIDLRREDGVAMTEFALIVPVFMLIVVGMLVFGRLLFYWIETNHVASETARWAVVDRNPYSPRTLQQSARSRATDEFENNAAVCIDYPGKDYNAGTVEPGDPVRVRVQVPVSFVKFFGWGVTIRGSATMRVEQIVDTTAPIQPLANPNQNIGTCS
jgi:Flp pilus assembly protein TadG